MQGKIKICFVVLSFFYISVLIGYQYKSLLISTAVDFGMPGFNKINDSEQIIAKNISTFNKFISADYKYCGGLGNQLFHIAIYYGIGKSLNRSPFYIGNKGCDIKAIKGIKRIFPNIPKYVKLLTPKKSESKKVNNLSKCCNVSELKNVKEKYLIFKDHIPHFYQFFHSLKKDIHHLMEFNPNLKHNVSHSAKMLFKNDIFHKFCIHIRRGDFMSYYYRYQESRASFIIPASNYIHNYLRNKNITNLSLILLGQDEKFKHYLSFNSSLFKQIYYPTFLNLDQEFVFGSLFCDTFLISATASTFAWWIAYLMPEGRNIFYNGQVYKKGDSRKYAFDNIFPSNWNKIDLTL